MQKVPINLASPGMILAKPIMNDKGMPLCAEGTSLTETLIDRLRAMNITVLTVKGHPLGGESAAKTPEEKIQEIEERFLPVKGDPLMDKVRDAIVTAVRQEAAENQAMEEKEKAGA
jgi:hypothetical protein